MEPLKTFNPTLTPEHFQMAAKKIAQESQQALIKKP
jgi:hypothetical protein